MFKPPDISDIYSDILVLQNPSAFGWMGQYLYDSTKTDIKLAGVHIQLYQQFDVQRVQGLTSSKVHPPKKYMGLEDVSPRIFGLGP